MYPIFLILLKDEKNIHKAYKAKRIWASIVCFLIGVKVSLKDKKKLPKGPYVICANHASYLDIIVLFILIPNTTLFLGKAELLKWPFVRVFFKNMDIPVDRSNKRKAAQSIELSKEALRKGYNMVIFPEGTIPDDDVPKLIKFKNGAFSLAVSEQVPIVPLTYITNWKLFSHHADLFGNARPGFSKSIVHDPISTIGLTDKDLVNLRERTKKVIETPLLKYYKEEWK